MSSTFEIAATVREAAGKGASRRLRRLDDQVPGIIYGGDSAPTMLSLSHNALSKALEHEAFYSHILTITVNGKAERAVLRDLQRHPAKPRILHVDFQRVTGKEKITMQVPLHFTGAEETPGVKQQGGVITYYESDIGIRCLPDHLPESITVDVSKMVLDQTLHLSDIKLPKGVEFVDLAHENNRSLVSLHLPKIVVEEETGAVIAPSEVPTIEKGKAASEDVEA